MKKLFIFTILSSALLFINCGSKEKQEKTETLNDSIVTETMIIDSVTISDNDTISNTEIIVKDLTNEKSPVEKSTTVTKITTKEPGKVVTQKTTETKVNEDTKVEVETKVVVTEQPKIVVEAETPVKVVVQEPKVTTNVSDWKIPVKYQTMKNPTDPKVDLAIGKSLYSKHCKSCHGSEGYGDGTKANDMKGDLGDFSTKTFQAQSDGALFYKASFGRDDMPAFNKKMPLDEDRWLVVNYMRTLGQ
ncbi:cytochrome c [Lutibacter sp.]|uniref:c-type cytochrome n=1 Tax=Lutibacter sp. TaxID=1925666 RepID=UPI00356AD3DE